MRAVVAKHYENGSLRSNCSHVSLPSILLLCHRSASADEEFG